MKRPGIAPRLRLLATLWLVAGAPIAHAETESTTPPPGIREHTPAVHALTHARIVIGPGRVIPRGTLVIRDGVIVAVGEAVRLPADADVWDMTGRTLYAGLIDAYAEMRAGAQGAMAPGPGDAAPPGAFAPPRSEDARKGAVYWNRWVTPQFRANEEFSPNPEMFKKLRSQGITTVVVAPPRGVIRGTGTVVNLADGELSRLVVKPQAALHISLVPLVVSEESSDYPSSPMGAYALVRQAFLDAEWYTQAQAAWARDPALPRPETNETLAALSAYAGGARPVVIDAGNELYALRADRLARELRLDLIVRGSGREYRRLEAIRSARRPVIVPLNFPRPPAVQTPEEAANVTLEELMHWDMAPENPGRLARAGVPIAFTAEGLPDSVTLLAAVRSAVDRGLDKEAALRALTVTPAALFGLGNRLGTLDRGRIANIVVADGDLFAGRTTVREVWVDGRRFEVKPRQVVEPRGAWRVELEPWPSAPVAPPAPGNVQLRLGGEPEHLSGSLLWGREVPLGTVALLGARLSFSFPGDSLGLSGLVRMSATVSDSEMLGTGSWPDGTDFRWTARRLSAYIAPPDTTRTEPAAMASYPVRYPLGEFGRPGPPQEPRAVVFRNATVWTCGPAGTIERGTVIVERGRIAAVGTNLREPAGATIVDCAGRHLTPGIVDCHAHVASDGGINESGQTITAEVRIGDFIDPDDIDIYRQIAGGVTTAHVLHGSANTIGGQNQVIKMRWGSDPEAMKFEGATPTLKIALGENVKQSNWGDRFTTRYPQTRMGAEQLLRDEFRAARDYEEAWREWERTKRGIRPRRDLELDAVLEVLNGKRSIHCHAYRQDETLMMMHVCDDFGIRNVTFVHILEGYKVADEIARRGFGASTFSDWWAYKFEVYDAIPYGGALMHDAGVLVSFNSDSNELARRLAAEAGKARKYGGLPDGEALKLVTINPARQLGVGGRIGSIEAGKDADLALWSGPPLSATSRCDQTWIDGRMYFDRDQDRAAREEAQRMRASLIQKALRVASSPGEAKPPAKEGTP